MIKTWSQTWHSFLSAVALFVGVGSKLFRFSFIYSVVKLVSDSDLGSLTSSNHGVSISACLSSSLSCAYQGASVSVSVSCLSCIESTTEESQPQFLLHHELPDSPAEELPPRLLVPLLHSPPQTKGPSRPHPYRHPAA